LLLLVEAFSVHKYFFAFYIKKLAKVKASS